MVRHAESNEFVELTSEQRSGEAQYDTAILDLPSQDQKLQISLGYRRCLDFDEGDQPGQDFAAVRAGDGYVVGIVADGVSQSFYGNIAAQQVSTWLLDMLWEKRAASPAQADLEQVLSNLEEVVAVEVQNFQLPEGISAIQRMALENTRKSGSQAVFTAFVLNGTNGHLSLYQVGDVTAIVHYPDKESETVKAHPKGRWSTAGKSKLQMLASERTGVSGLVVKSDGVNSEWGSSLNNGSVGKPAFDKVADELAIKDDVSFIAVYIGSEKAEHQPVPASPITIHDSHSPPSPLNQTSNAPPRHPTASAETRPNTLAAPQKKHSRWRDANLVGIGIIIGILIGAAATAYLRKPARQAAATNRGPEKGEQSSQQTQSKETVAPPTPSLEEPAPSITGTQSNKEEGATRNRSTQRNRGRERSRRVVRSQPANTNKKAQPPANKGQNTAPPGGANRAERRPN